MDCQHVIDWDPAEIDYGPLGLVVVWHTGTCKHCNKGFTKTIDMEQVEAIPDEEE